MLVETFWRTILSFLALWAIARVLGKRQIGQLTLFDYITGITIGSIAASLSLPAANWAPALLSMGLWGALSYSFHWLDTKGRTLHRVIDGEPTILIQHGQILEGNLNRLHLNHQELMGLLRTKGYFNIAEVEYALLETNGELSVLPKSQYRPLQPRDLGISTRYEGLPVQVMQEGRPWLEGLQAVGLTEEWLLDELRRQGVKKPEEVFAAWLATDGTLVVDRYKDKLH